MKALTPIEQFKHAVQTRNAVALRSLLTESDEVRAAVNEPLFGFDSPALVSVSGGNDTAVLDVLLQFGADPDRKSSWWAGGFHPLYGASRAAAERLIAGGATIDACAAAHLDRLDVLETLIAEDPKRVHERGGDGQTPLHFAVSRKVVDVLLAHGADINARCADHRSTAAEWMLGERTELARYLIERGGDADIFMLAALGLTERARAMVEKDPSVMSLRISQGDYAEIPPSSYRIYTWTIGTNLTPLQVAGKFGHADTVKAMETFASPVQRLLLACNRGDRAAAQQIVDGNPGIIASLDASDRRALSDAAWAANAPAVELLLELGFDPSIPSGTDGVGGNALHCASWEGSIECVDALLRYESGRALLDSLDGTYNGTPLGWCCHGSLNCGRFGARHADVARALIDAGTTLAPDVADWDASEPVQRVLRNHRTPA